MTCSNLSQGTTACGGALLFLLAHFQIGASKEQRLGEGAKPEKLNLHVFGSFLIVFIFGYNFSKDQRSGPLRECVNFPQFLRRGC